MHHKKKPFDIDRAVRALLEALRSEKTHNLDAYDIVDLIQALQKDPGTNNKDLLRIELGYLQLLDDNPDAFPFALEFSLACQPTFFCEMIRSVWRSTNEEPTTKEAPEQQLGMAANARTLLYNWKTPPGCRPDGSYDGDALAGWLNEVRQECAKSGHLEVAMSVVGEALIHTPPDPDGLWIHRSAATALNAKDAEEIRLGFYKGILESRGFHGFTSGREERELAEKYRTQANEVEEAGFHRLATTLRNVTESYEHDADRDASRDPFDEY
jgi:hypothetical protein